MPEILDYSSPQRKERQSPYRIAGRAIDRILYGALPASVLFVILVGHIGGEDIGLVQIIWFAILIFASFLALASCMIRLWITRCQLTARPLLPLFGFGYIAAIMFWYWCIANSSGSVGPIGMLILLFFVPCVSPFILFYRVK